MENKKKIRASIWDRTRVDAIPAYGTTSNPIRAEVKETARANGWSYDRAAAAWMRSHLKKRFPEVVFSITSGGAGYLDNCNISIKAAPFGMVTVKGDPTAARWYDREDHREPGAVLAAVLNYCEKLHNAFDADDGDHYADYGARHDLYGGASVSGSFREIAPTPEQIADIADFAERKAAKEREDAEREEREFQERRAREAEEERERKKAAEEWAARKSEILARVSVYDLEAPERIGALFGGIGKECSASELFEYLSAGASYKPQEAEISSAVVFENESDLKSFSGRLLDDWDFLAGKGGMHADSEITDEEYNKMTPDERERIKWIMCDCVAVFVGSALKLIVDPEGYNYARYTYIPAEALAWWRDALSASEARA